MWFSLQKLSRARTQHSGTATHGAATSLSVRVHKAVDLSLDEETDRDSIDGLVVRLRLQTEDGAVLAETQGVVATAETATGDATAAAIAAAAAAAAMSTSEAPRVPVTTAARAAEAARAASSAVRHACGR